MLGEDEPTAPIVLGKSLEGVKFGDSKEEMIAKLGKPDQEMNLDVAGPVCSCILERMGGRSSRLPYRMIPL